MEKKIALPNGNTGRYYDENRYVLAGDRSVSGPKIPAGRLSQNTLRSLAASVGDRFEIVTSRRVYWNDRYVMGLRSATWERTQVFILMDDGKVRCTFTTTRLRDGAGY